MNKNLPKPPRLPIKPVWAGGRVDEKQKETGEPTLLLEKTTPANQGNSCSAGKTLWSLCFNIYIYIYKKGERKRGKKEKKRPAPFAFPFRS